MEAREPRAREGNAGDTTVEGADRARSADPPRLALDVVFGRVVGAGRRFALGVEPLRLGREVDDGHVQLDDPRASRRHAEIHWSEIHRRSWIRDLGSRNGVYLNGHRVARELLCAGDVLRVGDTIFGVALAAPDDEVPVALDPDVVGASRSIRTTFATAARVAGSAAPVLVLGPTGTGKELVARAIHRASARRGPLVAVNCAALPAHLVESELFGHDKGAFSGAESARPGLFRGAHGGTLFLDEVGELALDVQAKLLRVIDARSVRPVGAASELPVDVQLVAATNRDLAAEVERGGFRADLYARLRESVVAVAPLRERLDDLDPLWCHFVAQLGGGATLALDGDAGEAMALHTWPFNVRELRQLVRAALLRRPGGGVVALDDLPPAMRPARAATADPATAPTPLLADGEVPSKPQLRRLVEEFRGNVQEIAAYLRKDRKQIYRWLSREQIDPNVYR